MVRYQFIVFDNEYVLDHGGKLNVRASGRFPG